MSRYVTKLTGLGIREREDVGTISVTVYRECIYLFYLLGSRLVYYNPAKQGVSALRETNMLLATYSMA